MRSTINKFALTCLSTLFPTQKPTLFLGENATEKLVNLMVLNGHQRPLIIADGFIHQSGMLDDTLAYFKEHNCQVSVFDNVLPNPTMDLVDECVKLAFANQCDSVLVVGGGSAIDIAKVVVAAVTNGGNAEKLIGFLKVKKAPLPFYAVPSTSGTGSEVTVAAVISDHVTHQKLFFVDAKYVPGAAALDTSVIASLPPAMTAATGMDALTHAIEAYVSKVNFVDAQRDALTAIKLLVKYLPIAYQNGSDLEAREMVALGSFLAGYAFSKSGLGYVHAISHQISAHYNTAHGLANAVILPKVVRFNRDACRTQYAEIERALRDQQGTGNDSTLANDFVARIDALGDEVAIPLTLEEVKEENFTAITSAALKEANSSYAVPKTMQAEDVKAILSAIVRGEREVAFS